MFEQKIGALQHLKAILKTNPSDFQSAKQRAIAQNGWFTKDAIEQSVAAIADQMLDESKLKDWISAYTFKEKKDVVAIVPAGNIPLVGFHDLLCCFVADAPTLIKLSSKDDALMRYMIQLLHEADPDWKIEIVERLTGFDKVIATGSNNTHRYFEQYFGKVPSILRKNRNSMAVLTGEESDSELTQLSNDIFPYFGLGCRNVSLIWLPEGFDVTRLFPIFDKYQHLRDHRLYMDNYDYNRTLLLMNQTEHLANDFVMLVPDVSLHARIATVHYQYYKDIADVQAYIAINKEALQCIVSKNEVIKGAVELGTAQQPELWDYADGADIMAFLLG